MAIAVTQKHIQNGKCGDPSHCPIALALKDHGYSSAHVDVFDIAVNGKESYLVEDRIGDFIEEFDNDGIMYPFKFAFINGEARIVE